MAEDVSSGGGKGDVHRILDDNKSRELSSKEETSRHACARLRKGTAGLLNTGFSTSSEDTKMVNSSLYSHD